MNLFDPFVDRDKKKKKDKKATDKLMVPPLPGPKSRDIQKEMDAARSIQHEPSVFRLESPTPGSGAEGLPTRPRLAQVDTPPPAPKAPSLMDQYNQIRKEREQLAETKPVNNDKGFWGRIGDIFRQAVISAGETYRDTRGTPEERLAAAVGGGIAGGAYGGFHPQVDEERKQLFDIAKLKEKENELLGQIQLERGTRKSDLELEAMGIRNNNMMQEAELNAPVSLVPPGLNTPVNVTGAQALSAGLTLEGQERSAETSRLNKAADLEARSREKAADREHEARMYNVRTENDANKFNAQQDLEAQKANAKAIGDYSKQETERILKAAEANAGALAASGQATAAVDTMRVQQSRIEELTFALENAVEPQEINNLQSQLSRAYNEFNKTIDSIHKSVATATKNSALAEVFRSNTATRPPQIKPTPFRPKTLETRRVNKAKDPLGLFQ